MYKIKEGHFTIVVSLIIIFSFVILSKLTYEENTFRRRIEPLNLPNAAKLVGE